MFATLFLIAAAGASVYIVRPDGTGDFPTIQAAIDGVNFGDVIELTAGTFTGSGNRDVDFHGKAVTVRSQDGNPGTCTIDCEHLGRGFALGLGEGPGSVLQGLTVVNGESDNGGAVSCYGSSPRILGCVFMNNSASVVGGAVSCLAWSSPEVNACVFQGNSSADGGALQCWGYASPHLSNCLFGDNEGRSALGCRGTSSATLERCTFAGNNDVAILCESSSPTIRFCTLVENRTGAGGAGIQCTDGSHPVVENTIIAFTTRGAAIGCDVGSVPVLECCDLYGNVGGDWVGPIEDQYGTNGNIALDPLFCGDVNPGDPYTLWSFSPCAADNNPECGQIGASGVGCTGYLVTPDGTGDFATIQEAITASSEGGFVCLADGIFGGPGNRDLDFEGRAIELRAVHSDPSACVIDCEHAGRGLTFQSGEGPQSVVRGLGIRNGLADRGGALVCLGSSPRLLSCLLWDNSATMQGGAIYCQEASPTFTNCTLVGNSATDGGGIFCTGGSGATLENTIIASSEQGAAIGCDETSSASLACCDIWNNAGGDWVGCIATQQETEGNICADPLFCGAEEFRLREDSPCAPFSPSNPECDLIGALPVGCSAYLVTPDGSGDFPTIQAAIDALGDGATIELADGVYTGTGNRDVSFHGKALTIRARSGIAGACIIDCEQAGRGFIFQAHEGATSVLDGVTIRNGSQAAGGAIACLSNSSPMILHCTLQANFASANGGAVRIGSSSPKFVGCTIAANASPVGGAVACINNSAPVFENCIIAFSVSGEAFFCYDEVTPTLSCCDIYGNAGGDWTGYIADQYGVDGNIAQDPLFCDLEAGDFGLQEGSPCAPFAPQNPECDLVGAWPEGCASDVEEPLPHAGGLLRVTAGPNPFARTAKLTFAIPRGLEGLPIRVSIHDLAGRIVCTLFENECAPSGLNWLSWDGRDRSGRCVGNGVYLCRLEVGHETAAQRIVHLR